MSVSCQGQKVHTLSGRELVTGTDIQQKDMFSGHSKGEHVPANPFAIFAFAAAAAGALATVSSKTESKIAGILGVIGAVLLVGLKSNAETDMTNKTQGMAQVQMEFGFWCALLLLVIAALSSFGLFGRLVAGPRHPTAPDGR